MIAGFVSSKCGLGRVDTVANQEDFATVVPQWIHHISGIRETSTLITFNAFK